MEASHAEGATANTAAAEHGVMQALADLSLARRLEMTHAWRAAEYARTAAALHPASGATAEAAAGGYVVYGGPTSPVTGVSGAGLHGAVSAAEWDRVELFLRSRGVATRVHLCPLVHPSLLELLRQRGYRLEGFLNVLFCPLAARSLGAVPSGLTVVQAGPGEAELWIRTTAQGFDGAEVASPETLDVLAPNFHSRNATPFLAWVEGQPAGGAAIFTHEGVAEFGGDSTRPAFRRRGVHLALLQARLAAAHKMGCDLAMLVTEPGSAAQRHAERVGFGVAYTKVILVGKL